MHIDFDPRVPLRLLLRRPEIVHTHLVHADVLGLPAAAFAGVPVRISTKHGFNEWRSGGLFANVDRAAAHFAHRQIAISRGLALYLSATQGFDLDRFTVVHYGIDAGPEPPSPPAAPRLVAVGRLIQIKGFDILLRAFTLARREVPELTLELAGAGALAQALQTAAPEGVTMLGHVADVGACYERNAIVVVPSRGEGFGMVALEAAERGRAAIVTGVGGLPEIVADGETGFVVPPEDEHALARAIVELARDPARIALMGAAARRRALTQFTTKDAVEGVAAVYRSELARRTKLR
jgi:glycosyltransferase involved in cell wall biosynthesis